MMLTVDIRTKVISDKQTAWVVFPGRRRQYYEYFLSNSIIFLDYPGLDLRNNTAEDMERIRQHVRMSNAIDEYDRSDVASLPPSTNPANYSTEPFEEHSSRTKAGNVRRLYNDLKIGDLIIVPGSAFDPVLFGEITQKFSSTDTYEVKSGEALRAVQARKVRWTKTDVLRTDIPRKIQPYLSKPPAVSAIPQELVNEKLYSSAYEAFVFKNISYQYISASGYSGLDPRATEEANQLISYFLSAYIAIERDSLEQFIELEIDDAIDEYFDENFLIAYEQVFRSPGHFGILGHSARIATFVAICTTLSASGVSVNKLQSGVRIENSEDKEIQQSVNSKVEHGVNALMHSLSEERLKQIKKRGAKANKKLTIKPKPIIK